jgi:hypothetical protein
LEDGEGPRGQWEIMAKTAEQPDDRADNLSAATAREQLRTLLDALPDDQVQTVLSFVTALSRGRVVVSACDVGADDADRESGRREYTGEHSAG